MGGKLRRLVYRSSHNCTTLKVQFMPPFYLNQYLLASIQSNLHKNVLELRSFSWVGGDFGPLGRAKHKHVSHRSLVRARQNYRPAVILAHGRSQTDFLLKKALT